MRQACYWHLVCMCWIFALQGLAWYHFFTNYLHKCTEESFIKEKRELLVNLLLKHDRATMQIFGLVGSPSAEAKKKSYKLRSLVSQKAFTVRFEEVKQLVEEADKQVALDQARKKKQQQQMQMQMMMGGGGGMPGMNDIPPELLMQMMGGMQ